MFKRKQELQNLIAQSVQCSLYQDYRGAIQNLETAHEIMKKDVCLMTEYADKVLGPLGKLYSATKDYKKAIEVQLLQIDLIKEEYGLENLSEANLPEKAADKLTALFMANGVSYSQLNKYAEAKEQCEMGYVVALLHFGEQDVRTLKLAHNLIGIELKFGDRKEAIRQLEFSYCDLRDYLGKDNPYTQKAKASLEELGCKPERLYKHHKQMKEAQADLWKRVKE